MVERLPTLPTRAPQPALVRVRAMSLSIVARLVIEWVTQLLPLEPPSAGVPNEVRLTCKLWPSAINDAEMPCVMPTWQLAGTELPAKLWPSLVVNFIRHETQLLAQCAPLPLIGLGSPTYRGARSPPQNVQVLLEYLDAGRSERKTESLMTLDEFRYKLRNVPYRPVGA